jgi:hypothetical protein
LIDMTTDGPALSNSKAAIPNLLNRVIVQLRRKYSVKAPDCSRTPLTMACRCEDRG